MSSGITHSICMPGNIHSGNFRQIFRDMLLNVVGKITGYNSIGIHNVLYYRQIPSVQFIF